MLWVEHLPPEVWSRDVCCPLDVAEIQQKQGQKSEVGQTHLTLRNKLLGMLEKQRRLQHYKSRKNLYSHFFHFAPNESNMLKHTLETQNCQVSLPYTFIKFQMTFLVIILTVWCYFYSVSCFTLGDTLHQFLDCINSVIQVYDELWSSFSLAG